MSAGKPQRQAVAIALREAGQSKKDAAVPAASFTGGMGSETHPNMPGASPGSFAYVPVYGLAPGEDEKAEDPRSVDASKHDPKTGQFTAISVTHAHNTRTSPHKSGILRLAPLKRNADAGEIK
jgi:hypothetical protein